MSRSLTISDEAYKQLKKRKYGGSFSQAVLRLIERAGPECRRFRFKK